MAQPIDPNIADTENKEELREIVARQFGNNIDPEGVDIAEEWKFYHTTMRAHNTDVVVIFRESKDPKDALGSAIGCVRVYKDEALEKVDWELYGRYGTYVGRVKAGCKYETMLVEVKEARLK